MIERAERTESQSRLFITSSMRAAMHAIDRGDVLIARSLLKDGMDEARKLWLEGYDAAHLSRGEPIFLRTGIPGPPADTGERYEIHALRRDNGMLDVIGWSHSTLIAEKIVEQAKALACYENAYFTDRESKEEDPPSGPVQEISRTVNPEGVDITPPVESSRIPDPGTPQRNPAG